LTSTAVNVATDSYSETVPVVPCNRGVQQAPFLDDHPQTADAESDANAMAIEPALLPTPPPAIPAVSALPASQVPSDRTKRVVGSSWTLDVAKTAESAEVWAQVPVSAGTGTPSGPTPPGVLVQYKNMQTGEQARTRPSDNTEERAAKRSKRIKTPQRPGKPREFNQKVAEGNMVKE